jgi:hypothetical protein
LVFVAAAGHTSVEIAVELTEGVKVQPVAKSATVIMAPPQNAVLTAGQSRIITVRDIKPSTGIAATVTATASSAKVGGVATAAPAVQAYQIVVLPAELADRVWRGKFNGRERVFISGEGVELVLTAEEGGGGPAVRKGGAIDVLAAGVTQPPIAPSKVPTHIPGTHKPTTSPTIFPTSAVMPSIFLRANPSTVTAASVVTRKVSMFPHSALKQRHDNGKVLF